jgi:PPOX class probable F420-dependent enzyme
MLEPAIADLARRKNFGTLCVQLPSGQIASHVMWVDADADHVLVNTEIHRAKYKAMASNPQVTVTIWDQEDPYRYAEIRGRVVGEVRGPEARNHIDELSRKYKGVDYANAIESERVIVLIAPERQRTKGI